MYDKKILPFKYSYVKFSGVDLGVIRLGGTGLGNMLFPWARFIVQTAKNNLIPIAPTWPQLKPGPILRREKDKRSYHDLFSISQGQITGLKKLVLMSTLKRVVEQELYNKKNNTSRCHQLVIFEGIDSFFEKILNENILVWNELLAITKEKHKSGLNYNFKNTISVHIRLTDFAAAQNEHELENGKINTRLPISWYVNVVSHIRLLLGHEVPVFIFSDGSERELSDLLKLPNCQRLSFGSSIADLIALSKANVLIASGSTFSMWASYLGRMPIIWHKGQLKQRLYYDNRRAEVECSEVNGLPASFNDVLMGRFIR